LSGSVESAYALFEGMQIFYNFIDKHGALNGKTPSQLAIPKLKFETPNRWLELIGMSKTTAQNEVLYNIKSAQNED